MYILVKFIKAINSGIENEQKSKIGKTGGLIMMISTLLVIISRAIYFINMEGCFDVNQSIVDVLYDLYLTFFGLQSIMLIMVFFAKLNAVFHNSPYCLSTVTKRIYISSFILFHLYIIIGWFVRIFHISDIIASFITLMGMGLLLILLLSLLILFIYKLLIVYKNCGEHQHKNENFQDDILINAIVKTTILCSISLITSLIDLITSSIHYYLFSSYIWLFIPIFDCFTNLLCVFMCFKAFKENYLTLCLFLDVKCKTCLKNIFMQLMSDTELAISMRKTQETNVL